MPTMVFRSKVDAWIRAVLIGAAIACTIGAISLVSVPAPLNWFLGLLLMTVGAGLPCWILFSTSYTLTSTDLLIQSGPFRQRVRLSDVRSISPTRDVLASPALSLDRLRIDYGTANGTMVSPIDKERFLIEAAARGAKIG